MKTSTRMAKYMKARNLVNRWGLLSKARKRYVSYLVKRYGYRVDIAIQVVYFFGFDAFPYDYHTSQNVEEQRTARSFGL